MRYISNAEDIEIWFSFEIYIKLNLSYEVMIRTYFIVIRDYDTPENCPKSKMHSKMKSANNRRIQTLPNLEI